MALTPDQIAREREMIGNDLPQDLGSAIEEAANIAIQAVKDKAPAGTGSLRDSIRAEFDGSTLTLGIKMDAYGYFQNYGVTGTKNTTTQFGVPDIVAESLPPRSGNTYSFNSEKRMIGGDLPFGVRVSIHQKGLNAKQFLDIESFVEQVADLVNENLEL